MPLPNFVPLIGSGFDQLAAQRAGWAGFDRGTQEENFNRMAAAEAAQNNWLQQVAAMRDSANQQGIRAQLAQDASDRDVMLRQQQEQTRRAERQQDIGLNQSMWAERLKEERLRTEASTRKGELALKLQQQAQDTAIDQHGQAAAGNYMLAKNAADQAKKELEDLDSQIADKQQAKANSKDIKQQASLGTEIQALQKRRNGVATTANRAENHFQLINQRLVNNGFDVDEDAGQIVHSGTGKRWSFKTAMRQAQSSSSGGGNPLLAPFTMGPAVTEGIAQSMPWAGFGGTQTATAPSPPIDVPATVSPMPTNAMKIGRFTVQVAQ